MKKLKLSLLMLVAVISATAFAVNSEAAHADTVKIKPFKSNTNQAILMWRVNGCGSKMVNVIRVSLITWERTTGSLMVSVKIQVGAMRGG